MKSIIVDDEPNSRESLKILVEDFCEGVQVCALCRNVAEGEQAIKDHKPDIVFLDIQMQRETGFDLLTKFTTYPFSVIFTTAYSEYALKAFRFSAIDYLLKPIDIEELRQSIKKVEQKRTDNLMGQIGQLIQNMNTVPQDFKMALPSLDGLVFIKVSDIVHCAASGNYTEIFSKSGEKYLVSRTLKEYDEQLADYNFFRIHHSYLINLNYIEKYVRGDGGYVIMHNGINLDVSKRKKDAFLEKIGIK